MESRPPRAAHPDRPSCGAVFRTTVEPAGTANRTSRDQRGKRTGFWHTVQFSRCERRPEGRDSKEWGRATHHGRHVSVRRQPRPITRPRTPPARHDDSRKPSRRGPVAVDRTAQGSATPRPGGTVGDRWVSHPGLLYLRSNITYFSALPVGATVDGRYPGGRGDLFLAGLWRDRDAAFAGSPTIVHGTTTTNRRYLGSPRTPSHEATPSASWR